MSGNVWLLTVDESRRTRWREALERSQLQVVLLDETVEVDSTEQPPEVIIVDQALPPWLLRQFRARLARGHIGVIHVAAESGAKLAPAAAAPRESESSHLGDSHPILLSESDAAFGGGDVLSLPEVVGAPGGTVDVSLPVDVTDREVRLACQMLAKLVRSRRRLSSSMRQQRWLLVQTLTDDLTGLPNRRSWEREIDRRRHRRDGLQATLGLLDVDHFREVNRQYGHREGDEVLRRIAGVLREGLKDHGLAARLGGDEFIVLIESPEAGNGVTWLDDLRVRAGRAASTGDTVTLSAGCCAVRTLHQWEACLDAADSALRRAKMEGRNRTAAAET